jgi:hypothetical protein
MGPNAAGLSGRIESPQSVVQAAGSTRYATIRAIKRVSLGAGCLRE